MSVIARLHSSTISNGLVVNASDLNDEFNQLVNEANSKDTRLTNLESNNETIGGVKTFSGSIIVANLVIKGGYAALPNVIYGLVPTWSTNTNIIVGDGWCTDSTAADTMVISSPVTINCTTTGAGGLDTGALAASTWYYVYVIKNTTTPTVSALASTVNESVSGSITLPSGYTLKRQLPIAFRTDGSSHFIPQFVSYGWPQRPLILYQTDFTDVSGTAGVTNIGTALTATSFTQVSATSFVPPLSQQCIINSYANAADSINFRAHGSTLTHGVPGNSGQANQGEQTHIPLDSGQTFDYKVNAGSWSLDVFGYVVDQLTF